MNIGKTYWVPLRTGDPESARQDVTARAPSWGGIRFAHRAKYLGFVLGPARAEHGWEPACAKFKARAQEWGRSGGGMCANTLAYSVHAFSTLGFLAQLDAPPSWWAKLEAEAMQSLYPGPYRWAPPAAVHGLPLLGFPASVPDLHAVSLAAKYRVCQWEAASEGGLRVAERAARLRHVRLYATQSLERLGTWAPWYKQAFLLQLDAARQHFEGRGLTPARIALETRAGNAGRIRRLWQRACVRLIAPDRSLELRAFLRVRLSRWACGLPEDVMLDRVMSAFPAVARLCPPRALAACIRTLWNGWATGRRFQRRASCFFGCTAGDDSIEHYADCPHVSAAVYRELGLARLDAPELRLAGFMLMAPPCSEATAPELRRRALATCGVYLTHCWARHAASSGALACRSALRLKLRELAGGS